MQNSPGTTEIPQPKPIRPGKVFIAIPTYSVDPIHEQCLLTAVVYFCREKKLEFDLVTNPVDSSPTRARNNLVFNFLQSDCESLLFIDSDILFTPNDILRICSHTEPIVGGFYPAKQEGPYNDDGSQAFPRLIWNTPPKIDPVRPDGLIRAKYMGTGFLRIKRVVFDVMVNKFGHEIGFHPDEHPPGARMYAFFSERPYRYSDAPDDCRFLTEDWLFCQRCADLGFSVWGDSGILLGHRGAVTFPLLPQRKVLIEQPAAPPAPEPAKPSLPGGEANSGAARLVAGSRPPNPLSNLPARLPSGFCLPVEALEDAEAIMRGAYDIPGMKEPPRTVLDAGAHVGLFSYWARTKWPESFITAFEPSPINAGLWRGNMGQSNNSRLMESALSDHNSEAWLVRGKNSLCHRLKNDVGLEPSQQVDCTDARSIKQFDFIKVDTEGSEVAILSALDLSETKAVVCEAHSEADRQTIGDLLTGKGFKMVSSGEWDAWHEGSATLLKFARPEALIV